MEGEREFPKGSKKGSEGGGEKSLSELFDLLSSARAEEGRDPHPLTGEDKALLEKLREAEEENPDAFLAAIKDMKKAGIPIDPKLFDIDD